MFRVHITLFALLAVTSSSLSAQDWIPLFDGVSLHGWTKQDGSPVTSDAWKIEPNGVLHLDTSVERGGNIFTSQTFGDFELLFEWKISAKGNNGIKYRVNDFDGRTLGLEYQVIDDQGYGGLGPKQVTASLYDLYEPQEHNRLNSPDQWNRGRIVVSGNRIEHWLNGLLVMHADVGSQAWRERVAASKFADAQGFGETPTGRIMITDHGDNVWYRNLFIRSLELSNKSALAATDSLVLDDPPTTNTCFSIRPIPHGPASQRRICRPLQINRRAGQCGWCK
ncbi:MAG: DUF1080 domain-containing protein [Planctomycetales bacterium]|nr:DUF1080 domain-containing protein [Planctomycetales bacterium]